MKIRRDMTRLGSCLLFLATVLTVATILFAQPVSGNIVGEILGNIISTPKIVDTIIPGGSQGSPPPTGDWVFDAPLTSDVIDDYSGVAGTVVWGGNATHISATTGYIANSTVDAGRFEEWGLLRAGATMNESHKSENFENWVKKYLTVNTSIDSPDNEKNARAFVPTDSADTESRVYEIQYGSSFCGNQTTWSVYLKAGAWSWIYVTFQQRCGLTYVGPYSKIWFDVENGTIGTIKESDPNGYYSIEPFIDGWYRVKVTNCPAECVTSMVTSLTTTHSDNVKVTTGDNSTETLYAFGSQVEVNPFASSYIRSYSGADTSSATEAGLAADDNGLSWAFADLDSDVSASLGVGGEGTLLLDFHPVACFDCVDNGTAHNLVSVNDNKNSTLFVENVGGTHGRACSCDGTTVACAECSWEADANYTMAVRWGDGTFQVGVKNSTSWAWGTEKAYDGSFDIGTKLRLSYENEDVHWHAKNLKIRNEKLSTAEIEAL